MASVTRKDAISLIVQALLIGGSARGSLVRSLEGGRGIFECDNGEEEEMYKEMYYALVTGISTFGNTLVDNISEQIRARSFSNFPNSITHFIFNKAGTVYNYAFRDNITVETIDLPVCTYCYANSFTNCSNLRTVVAPYCSNLGNNSFQNSPNVQDIYLNYVNKNQAVGFPWMISNPDTVFHFRDGDYDYQGNKL